MSIISCIAHNKPITPICQIRKLRLSKVRLVAQGNPADFESDSLTFMLSPVRVQLPGAPHSAEDLGLRMQDIVSKSLVEPVPCSILRSHLSMLLPAPGSHMFIDPFMHVMQMDT